MSIVGKIQQQTYEVQQAVFTVSDCACRVGLAFFSHCVFHLFDVILQSRLNDKMSIYDYFMNRSNVLQRVNQHIVAQSTVHNLCGKGTSLWLLH